MKNPFTLIDNLILIIGMMSEFRSVDELADGLNKSDRVIYRYIKALEEMGFEIIRQSPKRRAMYKIGSIPDEFTIKVNKLSELINSQS